MLRNPLLLLPDAFSTFSEAFTSMKRIADYLDEDEVKDIVIDDSEYMDETGKPQYEKITRTGFEQDAAFQWHVPENKATGKVKAKDTASVDQDVSPFTLRISELEFPVGELSIVCGPTGSGKTSLLYALLGEMDCINGKVHLPSKLRHSENFTRYPQIDPSYPELRLTDVAFVSQTAFLQHASIRDNILFGEKFEPERYKKVLRQCALAKDLSVLTDGDRTEIGEKGISLSGGQKQRVALARAVYSRAKTVLLDDCLSAVDSHTAKHLYHKCLMGDLMTGRTVILVTHHVKLCLPRSKYLVKLDNGSISGCGFTQDLRDRKILHELVGEDESLEVANDAADIEETGDEGEEEIELESEKEAKKLIEEEASEEGRVKFQVYKAYFDACGGWTFWITVIVFFIVTRLLFIAQSYWIRVWAAAYQTSGDANFTISSFDVSLHSQSDLPIYYIPLKFASAIADKVPRESVLQSWIASTSGPVNVDYYIGLYVLICFATLVIDIGKAILTYRGSVYGAQVLFHQMLDRIVHAPMRFFDTTPVGRILNRFGKDIATIDTQLARNALVLFECTTGIFAAAAVMISVTPLFIFACLIVCKCLHIRCLFSTSI
jgi:ABC-type multidrug transport system fused ATPase/permease subunit